MIIADSREPQALLKKMKNRFGEEMKIDALSWGDYLVVGDRFKVVIERKNIFDLFSSVKDKRLWKQIDGMRKYGEDWIVVVLIEGSKWRAIKGGHATYPQYVGIISSLLTMPNVRLVFVEDRDELIDLLLTLNKRAGNPPKSITWSSLKKGGRTDKDVVRDVLLAFNGIGSVKADEIMHEERSLISLFRKTKKKLMEKYGKVGEHIYNVLHVELGDDE